MSEPYLPEPDSCHPVYEPFADVLRQHFDKPAVQVMGTRRNALASYGEEQPVQSLDVTPTTLIVKRFVGPAPFIGDARREQGRYIWSAAVDDHGRHVAGPATLEIMQRTAWTHEKPATHKG